MAHLTREQFDEFDLDDLQIVFGDRPKEHARAVETRYPKDPGQAIREAQVRGFAVDEKTFFVRHWIAFADLRKIRGVPVFYASDIDRLCEDLAEEGGHLSGIVRDCVRTGHTLYQLKKVERAQCKVQRQRDEAGQ